MAAHVHHELHVGVPVLGGLTPGAHLVHGGGSEKEYEAVTFHFGLVLKSN